MKVYDVSTESLSIDDLVALLTKHPEGVEIRRAETVLFVVSPAEKFRTNEKLAWLASDPERYFRIVVRHAEAQSLDPNSTSFSDTFPS
jgi:hypothetical protein